MKELRLDELAILRLIERFQNKYGFSPTVEEIREQTGMHSKDHVYRDLKKLVARGFLKIAPRVSRGIILLRTADGYRVTPGGCEIPIWGVVTAGTPIPLPDPNAQPIDWLEVTRRMLPDSEGVFALRVRGNSMIDALVNDGDTVILKRQNTARNGELVAVRLRKDPTNPVTTLKRFYRVNGRVLLKPENPKYRCIPAKASDVEIQGKVLYVIRGVPGNKSKPLRAR